ncbi:hypothetical protein K1719_040589 [Acacia pycnantha]|nr:hypothetical protein K1719_040589 [Acacia pycnantha]
MNELSGPIPNNLSNASKLIALDLISYYELLQGTNGFDESNLLGSGSFGSVYKATLSNEEILAVKVFNLDMEEVSISFDIECVALRNLRHRNLIKTISSCSNDHFKSLIMEFMENGSLDRWLYSHNYYLDILQRLNIMIDVALALEYLHHRSPTLVVHCDVKPSNVLLDKDMVAHLSDFEYGSNGVVSAKGDVFSYGILLMEMFTRKKPTDEMFVEGLTLKDWVLYLGGNQLAGSIPSSIFNISVLQEISLARNQLSGGIPNEIGHLSQLKVLYLAANQLAGSIPSSIFNNSKLQDIDLGINQLSR